MNFSNKKIIITGGMGFIGSNLACHLVKMGANVTLIDSLIPEYGGNLWNIESIKDKVRINISDVRDENSMRYLVRGQDYLFNLAGQTSHEDSMNAPHTDLDINCRAQLFILEACRNYNPEIKIIFTSTRQIYGRPQYLPVDEIHPLYPVDINGINKISGEWYHLVYNSVYGIPLTVLRLTNTYGPHMRIKDARQTFLGIWIKKLLEGKPIQVFGDGKQIRDYNYIDDVISALLLTASSEEGKGEIYNLGGSMPINLIETAELLIHLNGGGIYEIIPFPEKRKKIDIGDYYADYRKIQSKFGWKPVTSLAEGFKKTIDFYRKFLNHY